MTSPATIRESCRRSPHGAACAGAARAHRGTPATMPALPKRHRRERAKARSGLVGLHTVRPSHRGRDPPARDRTRAHPAMLGVPDRHRPPASRRPDLRRRLPKCALAAVAQLAPPGTLIRGGVRWPNPPRTSTIRPAHPGPPTRTCSTHPSTASPRSSTARSTPSRAPHRRMRVRAQVLGGKIGNPFDYDASGPGGVVDHRRTGAAPRRRHPGPRLGGVAPGADGGATRHRVLHPRA